MKNWKVKTVKLADLIPLEDNPRKISQANAQALKSSLNRFGMVELIVWNEATGHIISGHQRYEILKSMGVEEVPVIAVDFDEVEEKSAAITMNNFEIEGEYTNPILELLESIKEKDCDLYASLRMEQLKDDVSELLEKIDGGDEKPEEEKSSSENEVLENMDRTEEFGDWDTECPCCGHKWKIGPEDISLEGNEQ